jgi:hypothetical protein
MHALQAWCIKTIRDATMMWVHLSGLKVEHCETIVICIRTAFDYEHWEPLAKVINDIALTTILRTVIKVYSELNRHTRARQALH